MYVNRRKHLNITVCSVHLTGRVEAPYSAFALRGGHDPELPLECQRVACGDLRLVRVTDGHARHLDVGETVEQRLGLFLDLYVHLLPVLWARFSVCILRDDGRKAFRGRFLEE